MSFLKDLYTLSEAKDDLSNLPPDVMSELQKNIRDGATDTEQQWGNALDLVHKAYEVAGVQRPTPDMRSAWQQYEENLQFAVEQLSKSRGMDGDWRMSSSMFHEAMEKKTSFRVYSGGSNSAEAFTVKATSIEDIVTGLQKKNTGLYDLDIKQETPQKAVVTFSKWGIKKNHRLNIEQLI